MIALNDDSLFVGQIKQVLTEFNLPNCTVGFKNPAPNRHFIANGYINVWKEKTDKLTGKTSLEYHKICPYKYNEKYLNLTMNLPIRNLLYDRETHRYLGKYLRFIRDFRHVNLMSMYNCFDGEIFDGDVVVNRRLSKSDRNSTVSSVRFKDNLDGFSIYSVPVDFQKLTIRANDGNMIYVCLCIDTIDMKTSNKEKTLNQELMDITLSKFHSNEVLNYDPAKLITSRLSYVNAKFSTSDMLEFIAKNIQNLKLLIKITRKTDVKITVLEGEYHLNYTLSNKYFVIEPLTSDYMPLLLPRYIDVKSNSAEDKAKSKYDKNLYADDTISLSASLTDPYTGYVVNKNSVDLDSDGYPIDIAEDNNVTNKYKDANDIRFALIESSNIDSHPYEILFVRYLVEPRENDAFRNPVNLKESGFVIIPQLLQQNDTFIEQYLLADRIIEYLSGNVICPLSADYDILRLQKTYAKHGYDAFNRRLGFGKYYYGIWSPVDLYNTRKLIADNYSKIDNIFDVLGYCDKEVEKLLGDKLDVV